MITADEALKQVLDAAQPLPAVERALADCLNAVLAKAVKADRDLPPADRSAMDGYAVRAADVQRPAAVLTVAGERSAGSDSPVKVQPGTCVRIYTGAIVPPGADAVVRLEDTRVEPSSGGRETVTVLRGVDVGTDVLLRGENARRGQVLVPAGTRLGPAALGLCAAVGCTWLRVHRPPCIRILTTGEELRDAGERVGAHEIRDSNGPMLAAAVRAAGLPPARVGRVADKARAITRRIRTALDTADVLITVGGVSVGRYDLVPRCVEAAGASIRFHQVAVKPGKPLLFAVGPAGQLVWGLPGNPVSAMVAFQEFVRPALRQLCGVPREACCPSLRLPLRSAARGAGRRRHYVLARLTTDGDGAPGVMPLRGTGSADLVALSRADGCFPVAEGVAEVGAGVEVLFRDWRTVL